MRCPVAKRPTWPSSSSPTSCVADGAEVAIATHDAVLREAILRALPGVGVEMLLGVRSADASALAGRGVPVRIYVPYGEDWFAYAARRWAESKRR